MPEREQRQHRLGGDPEAGRAAAARRASRSTRRGCGSWCAGLRAHAPASGTRVSVHGSGAERHRPLRIVDDAVQPVGLEIFRLDGERAHEALGIAKEMRRAIELRPQPFVRIEDEESAASTPAQKCRNSGQIIAEPPTRRRRAGTGRAGARCPRRRRCCRCRRCSSRRPSRRSRRGACPRPVGDDRRLQRGGPWRQRPPTGFARGWLRRCPTPRRPGRSSCEPPGSIDPQRLLSRKPGPVARQLSALSRIANAAASVADQAQSWMTPENASGKPGARRSQSITPVSSSWRPATSARACTARPWPNELLRNDGGRSGVGREVGEETWMLPVVIPGTTSFRSPRIWRPSISACSGATAVSMRRCHRGAKRRAPAAPSGRRDSRRPSRPPFRDQLRNSSPSKCSSSSPRARRFARGAAIPENPAGS